MKEMKKMKKFNSLLSMLITLAMCVSLITTSGLTAFAADGDTMATLVVGTKSLELKSGSNTPTMNAPVFYTGGVEYNDYDIAVSRVIPADGYDAEIIEKTRNSIKVEVTDGTSTETFDVELNQIGVNIYNAGNFENTTNSIGSVSWNKGFNTTNPGCGNYSLNVTVPDDEGNWFGTGYNDAGNAIKPVVKANKTYLSSNMIMLISNDSNTSAASFVAQYRHVHVGTNDGVTGNYYINGIKGAAVTDNHMTQSVTIPKDWMTVESVFTPGADSTDFRSGYYGAGKKATVSVDNWFLGELVPAKAALTDAEGNTEKAIFVGESAEINLTAKVLNQLGTTAGYDTYTNTNYSNWTVSPAEQGVSFENGKVIVSNTATPGTYIVNAPDNDADDGMVTDCAYTVHIVEPGKLTALEIKGKGLAQDKAFDADTHAYRVGVPVMIGENVDEYTYDVPEITATAEEGFTAECIMPSVIDAAGNTTATINVKNADGITTNTYTVAMYLMGLNKYADGGFENGGAKYSFGSNYVSIITDDVGAGSKSLKASGLNNGTLYFKDANNKDLSLAANTTYLTSIMYKFGGRTGTTATDTTSKFWHARVTGGTSNFYLPNGNMEVIVPATGRSLSLLTNWATLQTTLTTTDAVTELASGFYTSSDNADTIILDNVFLSELVISGINLDVDEEINGVPVIFTNEGAKEVSAKAINQLGTPNGLEDKVDMSVSIVGDAPAGVTITDNKLIVPQGTTGTVTVKVKATPNATWQNALQNAYEDVITINLVEAISITQNGTDAYVKVKYTSDADKNAVIYYAVYSDVDGNGTLSLDSAITEDAVLEEGEIFTTERTLEGVAGKIVKCFIWIEDTLEPLAKDGELYIAQ